jgi:hypothetical protein
METEEISLFILRAGGRDAERREQFFNTVVLPEPGAATGLAAALSVLGALARRARSRSRGRGVGRIAPSGVALSVLNIGTQRNG